jgi:hypothetical protein
VATEFECDLYKLGAKNKVYQWSVRVKDSVAVCEWGAYSGKLTSSRRVYDCGKEKRSPEQQAVFEASKTARDKKVTGGYTTDLQSVLAQKSNAAAKTKSGGGGVVVSTTVLFPSSPPHSRLPEEEGVGADADMDMGIDGVATATGASDALPPRPMLALDVKHHAKKVGAHVFLQPKLDGIRCIAHLPTGTLWSRQRKRIDAVPYLEQAVRDLGVFSNSSSDSNPNSPVEWLDGEIYLHGETFSKITSHARRKSARQTCTGDGEPPLHLQLQYHVYDCVLDAPFEQRHAHLTTLATNDAFSSSASCSLIRLVDTAKVDRDAIEEYHENMKRQGYEGTILRATGDVGYECGKRSPSLLKKKDFLQEEFVCTGFVAEKRCSDPSAKTLGSIVMTTPAGNEFRGRPAVTAAERKRIWDNQAEYVGQLCTVKFDSYTHAQHVPRFPIVVGFRHPDDV